MRIALASPPVPQSLNSGLVVLEELVKLASESKAEIVCFPESYLPGYPGMGYSDQDRSIESLADALDSVAEIAKSHNIAIIVPMDWHSSAGLINTAFVISSRGEILDIRPKTSSTRQRMTFGFLVLAGKYLR